MASIVIYFSRTGENYFNGQIRSIEKGNTEKAAEKIQKMTGSDIFKLEPVAAYSDQYNICIQEAKDDQSRNARPELKKYPEDLSQYDTIYLGYPNYWGTMPMCVFTFLENFDWNGKTIRPFCTHEGSGLGRSTADIKKICTGAEVAEGLDIKGSRVDSSDAAIQAWINA